MKLTLTLVLLSSAGVFAQFKKCGGCTGSLCPTDFKCVDDPTDNCDPAKGGSDCIGICVHKTSDILLQNRNVKSSIPSCGGFAGTPCPKGYRCFDDPTDNCNPKTGGADCIGICVKGKGPCGGFAGIQCPKGYQCFDNPGDGCDPASGGADCSGTCYKKPTTCGGFIGKPCPKGLKCVDAPNDDCDPKQGGADCQGICV